MPIPENITREHILQAVKEINNMVEIPKKRLSRKYFLKFEGNFYPPKYVISLANKYPNKEELDPNPKKFNTYMAQDYLIEKGFIIKNIKREQ